jgi:lipopolysaccharide export system permease protein
LAHRADRQEIIQKTLRQARDFKYQTESNINQLVTVNRELKAFQLEQNKRTAYAIACLIMLLIGASLGALIKKGGLGVPLLISTVFILLYYVVDIFGTKWTKIGLISTTLGAWGANLVLIPFALFFLWQAQKDTRLLDRDAYRIRWRRVKKRFLPSDE